MLGPDISFQTIDGSKITVILDVYFDAFYFESIFSQFGDPDQDDTKILLDIWGSQSGQRKLLFHKQGAAP